jgi:hypothetical protein
VTAIHQDRKLDVAWPPKVDNRIQRGTHCAPRIQHIVNQYETYVIDAERDLRSSHLRVGSTSPNIITIESDVDLPAWKLLPLNIFHRRREPT